MLIKKGTVNCENGKSFLEILLRTGKAMFPNQIKNGNPRKQFFVPLIFLLIICSLEPNPLLPKEVFKNCRTS